MSEQTFKFKKIKRKSTGYISYCIIQIYLSSLLHNWFDVNYENGIKDDEQWNTDENSLIFGSFKKVVIASTKKTRKRMEGQEDARDEKDVKPQGSSLIFCEDSLS